MCWQDIRLQTALLFMPFNYNLDFLSPTQAFKSHSSLLSLASRESGKDENNQGSTNWLWHPVVLLLCNKVTYSLSWVL